MIEVQSRDDLFEDIIIKMCSCQYIYYEDQNIVHKSRLTDNKELIDEYIRQIKSDYLNNLP